MPILSESECKDQYVGILDKIGNLALFQYTFIITVNFIFVTAPQSFQFLSFNLSRTDWFYISNLGMCALNLHIARHLKYLTRLLKMYPKQHRKLRFLTINHSWLLNPFYIFKFKIRERNINFPLGFYTCL